MVFAIIQTENQFGRMAGWQNGSLFNTQPIFNISDIIEKACTTRKIFVTLQTET